MTPAVKKKKKCCREQPFLRTSQSLRQSKSVPFLRYPKVQYRVHENPPLVPNLRHMNPVHNLLHIFFSIHFNITISSTSGSSKCSPPFRF